MGSYTKDKENYIKYMLTQDDTVLECINGNEHPIKCPNEAEGELCV